MKVGTAKVTPTPTEAVLAVDAGGARGRRVRRRRVRDRRERADNGDTPPIDTSKVVNPAPEVGLPERPPRPAVSSPTPSQGLTRASRTPSACTSPRSATTVPGQRKFNVDINGSRVLTDFEILAAAGGFRAAYAQSFDAVADANGRIVVAFTNGSAPDRPPWSAGSRCSSRPRRTGRRPSTCRSRGCTPRGTCTTRWWTTGPTRRSSRPSAPVTPTFAVQGTVANQAGDPEAGWTVFLDYDGDGQYDTSEPLTTTNAGGFTRSRRPSRTRPG